MARGNFLGFVGVEEIQIRFGQCGTALFIHGAFHNGDRVFRNNADAGVYGVHFASPKFAVYGHHFRFECDQHIAHIALQENGRGIASALGQNRHVFVELANKLGRLGIGSAFLSDITPGGQIRHAAIATGLWVYQYHLNTGLDQVVPVFDAFGIALACQEQHGA